MANDQHTNLTGGTMDNWHRWVYTDIDGTEWVIRAATEEQARAAAHCAEKRRTGSIAAGQVAARSVKRY